MTGDGTGATQTFDVPAGATFLALGIPDACGYNGPPSCSGDNFGSFTVTSTGTGITPPPPVTAAVSEPETCLRLLAGLAALGAARRGRRVTVSEATGHGASAA